MKGMYRQQQGNSIFYRWNIFEPWQHRFSAMLSTKHGKTSGKILNIKNSSEKERKDISQALGSRTHTWATAQQVHGVRIAALSGQEHPPFASCDAIIVDKRQYISGIFLADCHPLILYDPQRHVAAVAHVGWKGTFAEFPKLLVERFVSDGSSLQNIVVASGPGIGSCCYTVGEEVASLFLEKFGAQNSGLTWNAKNSTWHLNLENLNVFHLQEAGITPSKIGRGFFCTACHTDDFFSYRKENQTKNRYAALVMLH